MKVWIIWITPGLFQRHKNSGPCQAFASQSEAILLTIIVIKVKQHFLEICDIFDKVSEVRELALLFEAYGLANSG